MSHQATNWVTEHVVVGSPFGKSILTHLANCADPFGIAYPSIDYLVRVTELSRASVFRWIRVLEKGGALARIDTQNQNGQAVRGYQLALGKSFDLSTGESHSETAESQSETQKPAGATDPVSDCDSPSLSSETPYNPSPNPSTNPKPLSSGEAPKGIQGNETGSPSQALKEPIGFSTLISGGPSPELVQRPKALKAFVALDETSRRRAIDRWPLYGAACATARKKPRALHLWLAERGFDNAGAGSVAAGARRVFVSQNSPQWHAWLAAFASAYGGELRVPAHLSGASRGGILVVSEWPSGGERWIVPRDHWVFVEHGTSQHAAWAQRIAEIFHRSPTLVRAAIARDHHRKIGRGDHGALKEWNGFGLFVPSEWPPRKTEAPTAPDDQNGNAESLMSEEDMNERF